VKLHAVEILDDGDVHIQWDDGSGKIISRDEYDALRLHFGENRTAAALERLATSVEEFLLLAKGEK